MGDHINVGLLIDMIKSIRDISPKGLPEMLEKAGHKIYKYKEIGNWSNP